MNRSTQLRALLAVFALTACDRPDVVKVTTPLAVPALAEATGATSTGDAVVVLLVTGRQ